MRKTIYLILAANLLLAACQREALPSDSEALLFSASVAPMAGEESDNIGESGTKTGEATKATLYNAFSAIRSQTMYIWAYHHDSPYTAMFENKAATYNSTLSRWQLTEEQMWKKDVAADFFAGVCIPSSGASVTATHGGVTYTVSDISEAQTDALLGLAINRDKANSTDKGTVSLSFSHPYAAVKVKVNDMKEATTITGIELSDIYKSGSATLASESKDANDIQQFVWNTSGSEDGSVSLTGLSLTAGQTSEPLLVIPQTFSAKTARLTVSTNIGNFTAEITSGFWTAGYITTYSVSISPIGVFTVSVESMGGTEDLYANYPVVSSCPISFGTLDVASATPATKSLDPTTDLMLSSFGLYAGFSKNSFDAASNASNYIQNTHYTKDTDSESSPYGQYSANPADYWAANGNVSFFAYAPYGVDVVPSDDYSSGNLSLVYTNPNDDISNQPDLLIAPPVKNKTASDGTVSLDFNHAMCMLEFYACFNAEDINRFPYDVKIEKITLDGAISKGKFTFADSSPYVVWDSSYSEVERDSYEISRKESHIFDQYLPYYGDSVNTSPAASLSGHNCAINSEGVKVNALMGRIFMIPQTFAANTIKLTVNYSWWESGESINNQESEICLPATTWLPAKTYNYHFIIDIKKFSEIKLSGGSGWTVEDWVDSGNSAPSTTIE